jgi:hypothetical protein
MMAEKFIPYLMAWGVLAVAVIALAIYRWIVGLHEDDSIHIDDTQFQKEQGAIASKIGTIDRWGKSLTIVTAASGLALAAAILYSAWTANSTIGMIR